MHCIAFVSLWKSIIVFFRDKVARQCQFGKIHRDVRHDDSGDGAESNLGDSVEIVRDALAKRQQTHKGEQTQHKRIAKH